MNIILEILTTIELPICPLTWEKDIDKSKNLFILVISDSRKINSIIELSVQQQKYFVAIYVQFSLRIDALVSSVVPACFFYHIYVITDVMNFFHYHLSWQ